MPHLTKLRVFLFLLALASAWLSWPVLARWNFGAAPADMTFEAYLAGGARAPSVLLRGVLVDASHEVRTEMVKSNGQSMGYAGSYFPLRAGTGDARPVKVFLKWNGYTEREGVAVLAGPGESVGSDTFGKRANKVHAGDLQDVQVSRLRGGMEFGDDLAKVLHHCTLPTETDLILVEQNLLPVSTPQALGLLAIPLGCLMLLGWSLAWERKQDKSTQVMQK